ncbi:MAG: SDR family oxidoreductase [Gemmatimonadetes bacterium]|jgi:NAD(P)-dependent dehydrogenase (short-subunit alcohol dehydrogenase family)|nr:SDR family oxidoreductase [Gemmatimonadota bacterium]MBT5057683.1 SDR family oxidoreductase [Gemmatimonadota bacterium]MBT5144539.1 SDR family oxidoreductase [Gemmatimonadota bacterium]MBT5587196.1 SDR family oxidoreductase [Gemmatimonadota bacterium]MBT5961027.1 SDR family oxidoreductase [Gemmatimonadota bacterium]
MSNPHSLAGMKALVTGGKRRIGRGIALALAEAGCDVGINDLMLDEDGEETMRLIREMGRDTEFFAGSISDSGQVEAMFTRFLERFGRIDILANNPFAGKGQPFLELTESNWDANVDVGLKGFYLCSQQAARVMVAQGDGGAIVSTSSVHGQRAWKTDTAYGVAKAGVLRLTQSMAVDLGEYGIRCNAILPGHMDTGHAFGTAAPGIGTIREELQNTVPLRRKGTPEDIGRAAVFLCSRAAGCITGVSLPVDGGLLACHTD